MLAAGPPEEATIIKLYVCEHNSRVVPNSDSVLKLETLAGTTANNDPPILSVSVTLYSVTHMEAGSVELIPTVNEVKLSFVLIVTMGANDGGIPVANEVMHFYKAIT